MAITLPFSAFSLILPPSIFLRLILASCDSKRCHLFSLSQCLCKITLLTRRQSAHNHNPITQINLSKVCFCKTTSSKLCFITKRLCYCTFFLSVKRFLSAICSWSGWVNAQQLLGQGSENITFWLKISCFAWNTRLETASLIKKKKKIKFLPLVRVRRTSYFGLTLAYLFSPHIHSWK